MFSITSIPESDGDVVSIDEELALDVTPDPSVPSDGDPKSALLDPPTQALAPFDPFVKWLLSASIEEITSIHSSLPFELTAPFVKSHTPDASTRVPPFKSRGEAELARAEVEAECEAVADLLSVARRERDGIEDTVLGLHDEREGSRERISLLESRIVKHLQDRDLAIAEKYTTEKQIVEIEAWKVRHPEKRPSMLMGFLKKPSRRSSSVMYTNKDIERLQKDIADTKLETALAKTELDTHYYRLRQLEKKCVGLKLEIAQSCALEDDLLASLAQLRRERRSSLDKLQQVSDFSNASQKQASPKSRLSLGLSPSKSRSPRRTTMQPSAS